jgi:hypothetical protein
LEGEIARKVNGEHKAEKRRDRNSPISKQDINAESLELTNRLDSKI